MANRAKRLERELTLVKVENQFRGRFKKEKVKRKEGLKPTLTLLASATSTIDFLGKDCSEFYKNIFLKMEKLKLINKTAHQNFIQILQYPKPLFRCITSYNRILETFFELEINKPFRTWAPPKSKDDVIVFKKLFYHLFVKYKLPTSFDKSLEQYYFQYNGGGFWGDKLLLHMVKGGGLHQFKKLPIRVNSKVNYLFLNTPAHLDLLDAIRWAIFRNKKVNPSLASKMIHQIEWDAYWPEWLDELIFFLNRFKDINQNDLKRILEFFIYQKQGVFYVDSPGVDGISVAPLYPDFALKGRSIASVLRFYEEWKSYLNMIKGIGENKDFKPSSFQSFRIHHGKMLVTIKQIKNVKELFEEGKKMKHCVGTYAGHCVNSHSSIWTMKLHLPNKKVEKALTIEVLEKEKSINEALGKCNRDATDLENKWLEAWAKREQLKCDWK